MGRIKGRCNGADAPASRNESAGDVSPKFGLQFGGEDAKFDDAS